MKRLMPAFSVFAGLLWSFTEENGPWLIDGVASKLAQNLCGYLRQRNGTQEQLRNCTCVQTTLLNQFSNVKATQRGPKSILSHDRCTMWTRIGSSYYITSPLILVWLCKTWKTWLMNCTTIILNSLVFQGDFLLKQLFVTCIIRVYTPVRDHLMTETTLHNRSRNLHINIIPVSKQENFRWTTWSCLQIAADC